MLDIEVKPSLENREELITGPEAERRRGRVSLAAQVLLIILTWSYVCALHLDNNGLWFQGDSPRHAANGYFWKEYLASGSVHPQDFALSYYARYPVITPAAYPPVFYLLEAGLFSVVGPSPHAAKWLVQVFALVAAFYTLAWLRRWLSPRMGWAAALLPMLPVMVVYSTAVLLNVPACALGLAALYHARRGIEAPFPGPFSGHWYAAAALGVTAILTHPIVGVIVFVIPLWVIAAGRWRLLWHPRILLLAALGALLILPWVYIAMRWTPKQVLQVLPTESLGGHDAPWTYYVRHLPELCSTTLAVLAGAGLVVGLARRRWRREVILLLLWIGVSYVVLSPLWAKTNRYLLPLSLPIIFLSMLPVLEVAEWAKALLRKQALQRLVLPVLLGTLLLAEAWEAPKVYVRSVQGFREVVEYVAQVAPDEAVLYDGRYNGVFTFCVLANDPDYRRQVVLGDKLLLSGKLFWPRPDWGADLSPQEVVNLLQERGGCRLLAIERGWLCNKDASSRLLRKALRGPEFQLVRSFPISGFGIEGVDLYELRLPIRRHNVVWLPHPEGAGRTYEMVRPIQR